MGKVKSLAGLTAEILQSLYLLRPLDPLGNCFEVQRIAHHDDRPSDGPALFAVADLIDKRFVDLKYVNGKPLQVAERRISRPKIIDGQTNAEFFELVEFGDCRFGFLHHKALGDLEDQ